MFSILFLASTKFSFGFYYGSKWSVWLEVCWGGLKQWNNMYGHKIRVIIPSYNCRRHKKPNGAIVLLIFGEVDISRTLSIKRGLGSSCALVPKWLKAFKSKVTICMQQHENIRHQLFIKVWGRWRRSRTQKSFLCFPNEACVYASIL